MILKSVRVQNFKCIEDSGEFSIAPSTCLVGKNESGKTALLEALYKLNPIVQEQGCFLHTEYPRRRWSEYRDRRNRKLDNVLTTTWELGPEDIAVLEEVLGLGALRSETIKILFGHENKRYYTIELDEKKVVSSADLSSSRERPNQSAIQRAFRGSTEEGIADPRMMQTALDVLDARLPMFVYFDEYYKLPGQVALDALLQRKAQNTLGNSDRMLLALLDLVGTTVEEIASIGNFEPLIAELETVSNSLTDEMFTHWSQNHHLQVEFRFDAARPQDPPPLNTGYIFRTRIRNTRHRVTVGFDERSSGFIWFFSFLVWFSQIRKNYGKNLILLLDEPGLGLHPRAQADLLRYINEKLKPQHQVIYTTHSPFMVDAENILSARTVEDVVEEDIPLGTKVGDKMLSTDKDTVFPLQAALAYDITQTLFVGQHTLLVEGPAEFLFLKFMSRELQVSGGKYLDPRWTIVPAGGADKIGSFLVLGGGNKVQVAVLLDGRADDKRKVCDLRESNLLKKGHVFSADMYVDQEEADVEDLLGRSLYISLVNKCYALGGLQRLSEGKRPGAPARVVAEVEKHFWTLPPTLTFDDYTPAVFLIKHAEELRDELPGFEEARNRFERLFEDLNVLLP